MEQRKKTFGRIVELPCLDPPRGGVSEQNYRSWIPTIRREEKRKIRQLISISPLNREWGLQVACRSFFWKSLDERRPRP